MDTWEWMGYNTIFFCCSSLISICKHVLKITFFGFFLSLTGDQQERKEMSFRHSVRANKKRGLVHPQLVHHQLPATNRQMALPILNPPQGSRKAKKKYQVTFEKNRTFLLFFPNSDRFFETDFRMG